jgi:chromosome segregation ATPase
MRGMSSDPDIQRINNQLATIAENQARFDEKMAVMQEAIAGLIQVARLHDGQLDEVRQQIDQNRQAIATLIEQGKAQNEQIAAFAEQGKEQWERINALIRIVEGHLTNHP